MGCWFEVGGVTSGALACGSWLNYGRVAVVFSSKSVHAAGFPRPVKFPKSLS